MADRVTELVGRHRDNGILVDTNILLLLFVGNVGRGRIRSFKRTAQFSPDDFVLLQNLLRQFRRVLVTPHILAEVSSLGNQWGEPNRSQFYRVMAAGLADLEERSRASRSFEDVGDETYPRFGLTDSLTILTAAERCLVLTDDLRLSIELECRSCDVINFHHLRRLS